MKTSKMIVLRSSSKETAIFCLNIIHLIIYKQAFQHKKMERQFLIPQQNYFQQEIAQQYLKVWEQQQSIYKSCWNQQQYTEVQTQKTPTSTSTPPQPQPQPHPKDLPPNPHLLEILKQKISQNFTEYLNSLQSCLPWLQFEAYSAKRNRVSWREMGDVDSMVLESIQENQLLEQAGGLCREKMEDLVKNNGDIRDILGSLLEGCGSRYRDQLILLFFYTYNLTQEPPNPPKTPHPHKPLTHLLPNLYPVALHPNPNQQQKVLYYFNELIENWVRYLSDMLTGNSDNYQQEIEDMEWVPITRRGKEETTAFSHQKQQQQQQKQQQEEQQEQQYGDVGSCCRKIRPTFL